MNQRDQNRLREHSLVEDPWISAEGEILTGNFRVAHLHTRCVDEGCSWSGWLTDEEEVRNELRLVTVARSLEGTSCWNCGSDFLESATVCIDCGEAQEEH